MKLQKLSSPFFSGKFKKIRRDEIVASEMNLCNKEGVSIRADLTKIGVYFEGIER